MQTTETMTTDERNSSPIIRAELEATGCNVIQMPEHLNREQAEAMLTDLKSQALAHKAVQGVER